MQFDGPYYNFIRDAINGGTHEGVVIFKEEIWHTISLHSDDPDKMIFHLKHYIDHRIGPDELEVTLSDDYKKFKIYEFFQSIVNSYAAKTPIYPHTETELKKKFLDSLKKKDPMEAKTVTKPPEVYPSLF